MDLTTTAFTAGAALLMLALLDRGIWWNARMYLSMPYDDVESWTILRDFPNRKPFKIAKVAVGLVFVGCSVIFMGANSSDELGWALVTFGVLFFFVGLVLWESFKAFRFFADHNLPPLDRGGYIGR